MSTAGTPPATPEDLADSVGFARTVVDQGQNAYTVQIDGRAVTRADRGRTSWPRVTSPSGRVLVVTRAVLWLGTLADRERVPSVVWTFAPIVACTVNGVPVALGQTVHVLELAGLKWAAGGPRVGSRRSYPTMLDYLDAVADFTARARQQRWDLRTFPAEMIADELRLSMRRLYVENARAQIRMADIRRGAVTGSYRQMRAVLLETEADA